MTDATQHLGQAGVIIDAVRLLRDGERNLRKLRSANGVEAQFSDDDGTVTMKIPRRVLMSEVSRLLRSVPAVALIGPIIATVPLQLLAYHVAQLRGTDVYQPRNLAKSVTVE